MRPAAIIAAALSGTILLAAQAPAPPWHSTLGRDHPLAGTIWAADQAQPLTPEQVVERAADADFVLLGEVHDNPDAHRLQAWVLEEMVAQGRRPAVAFEMFDRGQEKAIGVQLEKAPRDADALAAALDWENSGWPDFAMYRPILQAALDAGLPVLPANLSRDLVRGIMMGEELPPDLPADLAEVVAATQALPEEHTAALADEIRDSHCGEMPESMMAPMTRAQKVRDVAMARALAEGARQSGGGAVLIAGNGHTRNDRGAPFYLRPIVGEDARILSLGIVEVEEGKLEPADYTELYAGLDGALPFDVVWFTPAQERADPCESLKRHMDDKGRGDG